MLLDRNEIINNDILDSIENIYGKKFYKTLLQVYEMLILDEKYYEECLTKNHCSENIKEIFPNIFLKKMERISKIKNFEKELLEFNVNLDLKIKEKNKDFSLTIKRK